MRKNMVFKFVAIGFISVVLLITLSSIKGLTREREERLREVEADIASSYAGAQRITGPIVAINYRERWKERRYNREKDTWYDEEQSEGRVEWVFPDRFEYDGELAAMERYRGIFKANVFQSEGVAVGAFAFPPLEALASRDDSTIELITAEISLAVSDARGITRTPTIKWAGAELAVEPGALRAGEGVIAALPDVEGLFNGRFEFEVELDVHGMGRISFVPVGAENRIGLVSGWPHPSFVGDFLATDRSVGADGFSAEWNVNGIASSARRDIARGESGLQSLGVELIDPISVYPQTDRALKYGFLFIFITFSAFFMYETLAKSRIHPVQYGFVGFAQAIFFLLLLSLSEHVNFGVSYFIASAATIGLIAFYARHVLKGAGRGFTFGGLLALLYAVLYALLRSEDHALVAGSMLIFGLMTLVMIITRKVDWYALGAKPEPVA